MSSILFAAEYHPPFAPGGGEWSNQAWAAALARRGHRVAVVTLNWGAPALEEQEGVTVVRVPVPRRLAPGQGEAPGWLLRNPLFHLYFAVQLARAARARQARLIHAQGKAALPAVALAAWWRGLPAVATVRDLGLACPHGACALMEPGRRLDCSLGRYLTRCVPYHHAHYAPGAGRLRRARLWVSSLASRAENGLRRWALRRARVVVGVSRGILDVHPGWLVDGGRSMVVPTLPPRPAPPTAEQARRARERLGAGAGPLVLYAGKLSPGKGVPVLLDAVEPLRAAVPAARVALAGKGRLAGPPPPGVLVLGVLAHAELFALYAAADVVVVPSVWPEPLSRVLLEAMALGRPVVATAVGGTPEAVEHGVTGLLVPPGDAPALAKALAELLLDPARARGMGEAAARRAARVFAEDRVVAALEAAYARALGAAA